MLAKQTSDTAVVRCTGRRQRRPWRCHHGVHMRAGFAHIRLQGKPPSTVEAVSGALHGHQLRSFRSCFSSQGRQCIYVLHANQRGVNPADDCGLDDRVGCRRSWTSSPSTRSRSPSSRRACWSSAPRTPASHTRGCSPAAGWRRCAHPARWVLQLRPRILRHVCCAPQPPLPLLLRSTAALVAYPGS